MIMHSHKIITRQSALFLQHPGQLDMLYKATFLTHLENDSTFSIKSVMDLFSLNSLF